MLRFFNDSNEVFLCALFMTTKNKKKQTKWKFHIHEKGDVNKLDGVFQIRKNDFRMFYLN